MIKQIFKFKFITFIFILLLLISLLFTNYSPAFVNNNDGKNYTIETQIPEIEGLYVRELQDNIYDEKNSIIDENNKLIEILDYKKITYSKNTYSKYPDVIYEIIKVDNIKNFMLLLIDEESYEIVNINGMNIYINYVPYEVKYKDYLEFIEYEKNFSDEEKNNWTQDVFNQYLPYNGIWSDNEHSFSVKARTEELLERIIVSQTI